jgi:DNA-binding transcriptional MerR regulator
MHEDAAFDLKDLCERTGVTARTVRYYVQQGLLPSPGAGLGARYGREHLDRLQLIRRLQKQHLPLAEIRRQLESLDPATLHALGAQPVGAPAPSMSSSPALASSSSSSPASSMAAASAAAAAVLAASAGDSAVDYVRSILDRRSPSSASPPYPSTSPAQVPSPAPSSSTGAVRPSSSPMRSQWDRIALSVDVELHIRRPLSRDDHRRVEQLIDEARRILAAP